ncbi:MAG: pilus assembly protein MshP [Gammaproteobacteria bacterium]|nr:pilus assembly protein MshP [Gammaproteobacteria bacterium]MDH3534648.1 pilus assembly protein MshP [Gammaproteobacteria bacterium]
MKPARTQHGFTLVTAIFLLVAVAVLVVYMSNIRVVQQTTLLYGVQGARAMQAARSGIEWGIYRSLTDGACPAATSFTTLDPALSSFTISVTCGESTHVEGATSIKAYQLTATASSGSFGSLDYVQRRMQATVSIDPP